MNILFTVHKLPNKWKLLFTCANKLNKNRSFQRCLINFSFTWQNITISCHPCPCGYLLLSFILFSPTVPHWRTQITSWKKTLHSFVTVIYHIHFGFCLNTISHYDYYTNYTNSTKYFIGLVSCLFFISHTFPPRLFFIL